MLRCGGGHLDFILIAPTMNLADFVGNGYTFNIDFQLRDLSNGFEELYLSGAYAVPNPTPTPEPASLILLGFGLAGAGIARWRRR